MKTKLLAFIIAVSQTVILNAQVPRKVLAEDFTGLWCGWCPLGRTAAEHLEATFPNQVINIGMHAGSGTDYLKVPYSNAIATINTYGYPGFLIDRTVLSGFFWQAIGYTGTDVDAAVKQRLAITSPVAVDISSSYNSGTRALKVTVTANFVAAAAGTMNISCVLVEDSISTPNQQHNYMNTDASTPWYNKGDPIVSYYQRHTARTNLAANWGDAGIIPSTVSANNTYSKTYTYTIPGTWDASHTFIVGFVSKYGTNGAGGVDTTKIEVLNANNVRLGTSIVLATEEITKSTVSAGNPFPNPSSGLIYIPYYLKETADVSVKIYDVMGRDVAKLFEGKEIPGDHLLKWNGTDKLGNFVSDGLYVCLIKSGSSSISKNIQRITTR
jgi:Outer membrane protein Omp28/FlgD Ig-like domain